MEAFDPHRIGTVARLVKQRCGFLSVCRRSVMKIRLAKRDARSARFRAQSSASVETTELERFVAGRLARYKCPRIYTHVETIPKGANNKLLRQVLRKSYEESPGEARTSRDG